MKMLVTVLLMLWLLPTSIYAESFWEKRQTNLQAVDEAKAEAQTKNITPEELKIDLSDLDPTKINIPSEYGAIIDIWRPETKPGQTSEYKTLVIEIQDPHCNVEAQTNISKMLKFIIEAYDVNFVAVEGAEDYIDMQEVNSMPNQPLKEAITEYFFKRGRITGVEYLALTDPSSKFKIYGIEDRKVYDQNYDAYLKTVSLKKQVEELYKVIQDLFNVIKRKVYSKELIQFDEKVYGHKAGQVSLNDYMNYLYGYITADGKPESSIKNRFPNFWNMIRAMKMEATVNFSQAEADRKPFVEELSSKLSEEDLRDVTKKTLQFKLARLSQYSYYTYLAGLADKYKIDKAAYRNLFEYIEYLAVSSSIDFIKLKDDMDDMEDLIFETLLKNDEQRKLKDIKYKAYILYSLYKLTVTRKEWQYFLTHKDEMTWDSIKAYLKDFSATLDKAKYDYAAAANIPLDSAVDFYKKALERDEILVTNGLKEASKTGVKAYVQVTGGFHAEGIKDILQQKNIPFIILNPKISEGNEADFYEEVMLNQKTELEKSMGTTLLE